MPSPASTWMTPPIRPSVFFEGRLASSLTRRQSGVMEEKILACFTCPHILELLWDAVLVADIDELAELGDRDPVALVPARPSISGGASSFRAITVIGDPELTGAFQRQDRERPSAAIMP